VIIELWGWPIRRPYPPSRRTSAIAAVSQGRPNNQIEFVALGPHPKPQFAWQDGYAAFSASASLVSAVVRDIQNQEAHHKPTSFDAKFIALLKKHGISFDPKFALG
jgi:putative transposase